MAMRVTSRIYRPLVGRAVDWEDRVHVVWTGLNRLDTSLQRDPYTGGPHDGYVQEAMYARR
jgi:hypothetical protein